MQQLLIMVETGLKRRLIVESGAATNLPAGDH
jgi:hypothetical protein